MKKLDIVNFQQISRTFTFSASNQELDVALTPNLIDISYPLYSNFNSLINSDSGQKNLIY